MSSFTAGDVVYTMEMSKNLKKQLIEQSTRQYSAGSSSMNNSKPLSAHMNYVQPQHQQSRNDINVDYAKMYGKCNASMQSNVVSNSAYNSGILASRLLSSQQREKHISNPNNNMAPIGPLHINSKYNVSVNPNANINANSLNHDHGQSRLMNSDGSATKNAVDLSQYHFPGSQQQEHMQRTAVPSLHTNSHAMPNIMGQRGAPTWEQSAVGGLNTRRNDVISLRDINSRMTSGPLRTSSMGNILGGVLDLPAYNGTNGQRFARGAHSNSMSDVSGLNGLSLHSLGGNATTLKSGSMKCNDLSLGDLNSNVNANDGSNMPMSNNAFSQYPSVTRETKSLPVSPLYHCQDQNQTESIFNFNFGEYSRDDTSSIPNGGVRNDAYSNAADNCITSGTTTSTDLIYNNGSSEYNTSNPISNFESKVETDAKTLNLRYKQEIDMDSELKDEADFLSKSGVLEGEITMSQNK